MGTRVSGPTSSAAVAHVTSGTYHRDLIENTGLTLVEGTEYNVGAIQTNIVADDGRDALFSWVRCQLWAYDTTKRAFGEFALIRCDAAEGTQDLNSDTVVENLHKQGRILWRKIAHSCAPDGGGISLHKFEVYNVKLDDNEELRLVYRPWNGSAASSFDFKGILEWREVGA